MRTWFTADLHIGHQKVAEIRLGQGVTTGYHDDLLAENWDSLIEPEDTIWVLGDISAGGSTAQRNALEWVKQRPGTKHLIAGNHDGCHPMHRNSHKWQPVYLEAFASVQMAARRRFTKYQTHTSVLLSHFPYEGDREFTRYPEWRLRDEGHPILHGHTHSVMKRSHSEGLTPQVHVGVDAWDLWPVSLEAVGRLL